MTEVINSSRRQMMGTATVAGAGLVAAAAVQAAPLTPREVGEAKVFGPAGCAAPEFKVDPASGALAPNPAQQVSYTSCLGCVTQCSVRVRIDRQSGQVIRVAGNPFSPLSTTAQLPYSATIRQSFVSLSRQGEQGLAGRSTACGRGAEAAAAAHSPHRVLSPLKRVGPRNGGQWQAISFEQLLSEICDGGNLFGEGHVAGLRALRDLSPIDPQQPGLGAKVNQVAMLNGVADGRDALVRRFIQQAYGTINFVGHGSYCGGAYRSGSGAVFGDKRRMPHAKPDFENLEFCIFIGTAPSNAGNPFKRQAALLARARTEGKLSYVVIDPVLTQAQTVAVGNRSRWIPIRPATDGALAMAMIRWILEQERYDARFLAAPNAAAAKAAGEASWSNASHLVITSAKHPRSGRFLRASDLGRPVTGERYGDDDAYVAIDASSGQFVSTAEAGGPARLFHEGTLEIGGAAVEVKTALSLLRESAQKQTLEQYSQACGIPVATIVELAREFTSHGKKAAVNLHGGMMAGNGFANAHALVLLNVLVGNLNRKGGTLVNGGVFPDAGKGPRYNLADFDGAVTPKGTPLGRNIPYEKSAEFERKRASGSPYPAQQPWFPNAPQLATEWLSAAFSNYPYSLKALLLWNTNPLYGVAGLRSQVECDLADPKKLPLIIAIDPFINETTAFADYIVPDTVFTESWGWAAPWGAVPTKMTTARWPVMAPRTQRLADGQPLSVDSFVIALAKRLGLPGFGAGAIADRNGGRHGLDRAEDWYLRGGANIAFAGTPVADASDDDLALCGVDKLRPQLEKTLGGDEWRKVAAVLAHGGRFQDAAETYAGEVATNRFPRPLLVYNEEVAASRDSFSGQRLAGVPVWSAPRFADGSSVRQHFPEKDWPLALVSYKSPLQSSYSIGLDRLRSLHPVNAVLLHPVDAQALGITDGVAVIVETPGGSVRLQARVTEGVTRGVAAIEHGFGHRELGARAHRIGGQLQPAKPELGAGANLNDLGLADPTRKTRALWLDPVAGSSVRNGLPARVRKA